MRRAKGNGYDVTALRTVIRLRKQEQARTRRAGGPFWKTYLHALGMV